MVCCVYANFQTNRSFVRLTELGPCTAVEAYQHVVKVYKLKTVVRNSSKPFILQVIFLKYIVRTLIIGADVAEIVTFQGIITARITAIGDSVHSNVSVF